MKAYWGVEVPLHSIFDLGIKMEVSGQLHASASLPQEKSPWYPLDWRLGGPQSRSGHGGELSPEALIPLSHTPWIPNA
jgi:hypothetical protein